MEAKDIKWCPQHGYPLPCHKCGMPLSQPQQREIYELGKKAGYEQKCFETYESGHNDGKQEGRREMVEELAFYNEGITLAQLRSTNRWQAKLKEIEK